MLPFTKRHVPYDQITDETTLLCLARDAEKLILDERNYVPPPLPAQTIFLNWPTERPPKPERLNNPRQPLQPYLHQKKQMTKLIYRQYYPHLQLWNLHLLSLIKLNSNQILNTITKAKTVKVSAHP